MLTYALRYRLTEAASLSSSTLQHNSTAFDCMLYLLDGSDRNVVFLTIWPVLTLSDWNRWSTGPLTSPSEDSLVAKPIFDRSLRLFSLWKASAAAFYSVTLCHPSKPRVWIVERAKLNATENPVLQYARSANMQGPNASSRHFMSVDRKGSKSKNLCVRLTQLLIKIIASALVWRRPSTK